MSDTKADKGQEEASAAEWRVFLEENLDALLEGWPKRSDDFWQNLPACPVLAMFELFPLVRPN